MTPKSKREHLDSRQLEEPNGSATTTAQRNPNEFEDRKKARGMTGESPNWSLSYLIDRRSLIGKALKAGVALPAAASLLGALGMPSRSQAASGTIIANLFDSLADEWFIDETNGAKEAAAALGLTSENFTFGDNPASEISQVQDAITRGVTMLAIYAPLGQGLAQLVEAAKGYAHLAFEFDIPPWTYPSTYGDAYGFYVVDNIAPGARAAGKKVLQMIGGKGNVVVMPAFPGGQDNEGGELGFKQALADFPDVKVLAKAPGHFSREAAQKLMADWLAQFPRIDALLSYADTQSLGAYTAMQQAGRTDIKIASVNGQLEGLQGVKAGQITATAFLNPFLLGGWRTVRLYDLAQGWKPRPLERMFWLDVEVVDQSNVDRYLDFVQKKPSPYDWKKMSRVLHPNDWEDQAAWYPINPVEFWRDRNLGVAEPNDWLPNDVKQSLAGGEFEKLVEEYRAHIGRQPI
jgi:ribose transport system substrate-binding protein